MNEDKLNNFLSNIFFYNPIGYNRVLTKYGCTGKYAPLNDDEAIYAGVAICDENDAAIKDFLMQHPDRDLFFKFCKNGCGKVFYGNSEENGNDGINYGKISTDKDTPIQPKKDTADDRLIQMQKELIMTKNMLKYLTIGAVLFLILK